MKNTATMIAIKPFTSMLSGVKTLTPEESLALLKRYANGEKEVKSEIVEGNLKFVLKVALQYGNAGNILDLIQEGTLGLMKAVDTFDVNVETTFLTYAYSWVLKYILTYLGNDRLISIPANLLIKLGKIKEYLNKIEEGYGVEGDTISAESISTALDISLKDVKNLLPYVKDCADLNMTVDDGEGNKIEFVDTVEQTTFDNPEDYVETSYKEQMVAELLKALRDNEKKVISMCYGLGGNEPMTYTAIALKLNLSRQRVEQIKKTAEKKMKEYAERHNLAFA